MSDGAADVSTPPGGDRDSLLTVFGIFLRLGLTSFGGPAAHISFFREELVVRRRWLSESGFADLVALCQFLPGPTSSQVGFGLGILRAGYGGALAAWLGFTLPSALIMVGVALGLGYATDLPSGLLEGLKAAVVAVVAQAVWGMWRSLCPDLPRSVLMVVAAGAIVLSPSGWGPLAVMVSAGVIGVLWFKPAPLADSLDNWAVPVGRGAGVVWLSVFVGLLVGLPLLAVAFPSPVIAAVDAFYRAGSLVFGGGHVVLPLLETEVVATGWVDQELFVAGYGVTQAMPGPLFTFAAFLGVVMPLNVGVLLGAFLCLVAIFVPSFFLLLGALPFWAHWRGSLGMRAASMGINAAVVGVLLAALIDPVAVSALTGLGPLVVALVALGGLSVGRWPPWLVVGLCAGLGWVFL